jgi:hypothetical protein
MRDKLSAELAIFEGLHRQWAAHYAIGTPTAKLFAMIESNPVGIGTSEQILNQ